MITTRPAHVLVTELLGDAALHLLEADPASELEAYDLLDPSLFRPRLEDADAVIIRSAHRVTRADLERAPHLRVVARAGAGVDNIDLDACTERGILVLNTPGANAVSAAEHTWGLLLGLIRHVRAADRHVRGGGWDRAAFFGEELRGRCLGVIGIGRVGREVVRFAKAFGMSVVAYDPFVADEVFQSLGARRVNRLEDLLDAAQVLTIHTPKTGPRLSRGEFSRLPQGAYVLNVARGGLMDEEALADLLESGHLAGVALDVFEHEPPSTSSRLLGRDDVLVTCHLGGSTLEAQHRIGERVARSVLRALAGEFPEDAVNVPTPPIGTAASLFVLAGRVAGRLLAVDAAHLTGGLYVEGAGDLPEDALPLASRAALSGLLEAFGEEGVNAVNAPLRAAARGIHVTEARRGGAEDAVATLRLRLNGETQDRDVCLTVWPSLGAVRLIGLWGAKLDLILADDAALVVTRHADRPGVVGRVGTLLGRGGVNIAHLQLGRDLAGGEAVMALTADSLPTEELLKQLAELDEVAQCAAIPLSAGR